MPETARKCLKCGVQHSDPAVVGRKSGSSTMPDDDTGTIMVVVQPVFQQCFDSVQALCCAASHETPDVAGQKKPRFR
jgi:hypothetical protein